MLQRLLKLATVFITNCSFTQAIAINMEAVPEISVVGIWRLFIWRPSPVPIVTSSCSSVTCRAKDGEDIQEARAQIYSERC